MNRHVTLFVLLSLAACGSNDNEGVPPQVATAASEAQSIEGSGEVEVSEAPLHALIESGDAGACANEYAVGTVLDKIRPDIPYDAVQRMIMKSNGKVDAELITNDVWANERSRLGSLDTIVLTGFDPQLKLISCSANFDLGGRKIIPVNYSMQPTADKTQIVYQVDGPSEADRGQLGFELATKIFRSSQPAVFQPSAQEAELIATWYAENDKCSGGKPDEIEAACERRSQAMDQLLKLGVCYGKQTDAFAMNYDMHRCGPDSLQQ